MDNQNVLAEMFFRFWILCQKVRPSFSFQIVSLNSSAKFGKITKASSRLLRIQSSLQEQSILLWSTITSGILCQMEPLQLSILTQQNKRLTFSQNLCLRKHSVISERSWWDGSISFQTTYYLIGSLILLFAREWNNILFFWQFPYRPVFSKPPSWDFCWISRWK